MLEAFARHGDQAAFEEVVRRYAGMVFSACMRVTKDSHDAEDVTQAVFLTLAVQCKTDQGVQRLGPWLKQVAQRASLDLVRSRNRREKRERVHGETNGNGWHPPSSTKVDLDEINGVVAEELARLPVKYRMPLVSLYLGGMSREEIAREMGLKPGTLAVRIQRGRVALARRLHERGAAPEGFVLNTMIVEAIRAACHEALASKVAEAAGRLSIGRDVSSDIASNVMAIIKGAAAAMAAAKIKTAAILLALMFSLAAGAAGVVYQVTGRPPLPQMVDWLRNLSNLVPSLSLPRIQDIAPIPTPIAGDLAPAPTGVQRNSNKPAPSNPPQYTQAPAPTDSTIAPAAAAASPAARPAVEANASRAVTEIASAASSSASKISQSGDVEISSTGWLSPRLADFASPPLPVGAQSLSLGTTAGSKGTFRLSGGVFSAAQQDIGVHGHGEFVQTGGVNNAVQVRLGIEPGSSGAYSLTGGSLVTAPSPLALNAPSGIVVGGKGSGTFLLGDSHSTGTILQRGALTDAFASTLQTKTPETTLSGLVIRADGSGEGTFRGWGGIIGVNKTFVQNGRVVADGYGQDRALLFVGYPTITNTVDNLRVGGTNGWFAQNHGQLVLPAIPVEPGTHTYTWGEDAADPQIDLVNSVRATLYDVQRKDKLRISLYSLDRADVPALPDGHHFIGVWSFDANLAMPSGVDLTVRYDDGLAARLGLNESNLKLWRYDGQWHLMTGEGFSRDIGANTLTGHADGAFSFFAVSAPEPSSAFLCLGAAAFGLLRRRRVAR